MDLAGSERLSRSKSTKTRLQEAKMINKSISALGNCINALIHPTKFKHIPYRDSKLTRILAESLGKNSKTLLIACISPSFIQMEETLSTLLFANSAKNVNTFANVNEVITVKTQRTNMNHSFYTGSQNDLEKRNLFLETENTNLKNTLLKITGRENYIDFEKTILLKNGKSRAKSAIGHYNKNLINDYDEANIENSYSEETENSETKTVNIIRKMIDKIADLQKEISQQNIIVDNLKKENQELLKENSLKLTDSGSMDFTKKNEAIIDQLLNIPQLRSAMITRLKNEGSFSFTEDIIDNE